MTQNIGDERIDDRKLLFEAVQTLTQENVKIQSCWRHQPCANRILSFFREFMISAWTKISGIGKEKIRQCLHLVRPFPGGGFPPASNEQADSIMRQDHEALSSDTNQAPIEKGLNLDRKKARCSGMPLITLACPRHLFRVAAIFGHN